MRQLPSSIRRLLPLLFVGLAGGVVPALAQPQGVALQPAPSQRVELAPFIGYRVGGGVWFGADSPGQAYLGQYDLDSSASFGLLVDLALTDTVKIEGLISHQDTRLHDPGFFGRTGPRLTANHFQAGVSKEFFRDRVRPFFSGLAGFSRYHLREAGGTSEVVFSFSFGGGVKVFMADNYGVRLDARAHSPFDNGGSGVGCGFGGCGFSLGSWGGNVQGEFSAAFIFAF